MINYYNNINVPKKNIIINIYNINLDEMIILYICSKTFHQPPPKPPADFTWKIQYSQVYDIYR